jgi:hypothetical protein
VGGDDGLGMTITSGPTSTADLSAALAGAGGTIGGSSGPDGVGPQYSDPGQAARLAELDALLNAPRAPVNFGGSVGHDAIINQVNLDALEAQRRSTRLSDPFVPLSGPNLSTTDRDRIFNVPAGS